MAGKPTTKPKEPKTQTVAILLKPTNERISRAQAIEMIVGAIKTLPIDIPKEQLADKALSVLESKNALRLMREKNDVGKGTFTFQRGKEASSPSFTLTYAEIKDKFSDWATSQNDAWYEEASIQLVASRFLKNEIQGFVKTDQEFRFRRILRKISEQFIEQHTDKKAS